MNHERKLKWQGSPGLCIPYAVCHINVVTGTTLSGPQSIVHDLGYNEYDVGELL